MGRKVDFEQKVLEVEAKVALIKQALKLTSERLDKIEDTLDFILDVMPDDHRQDEVKVVMDSQEEEVDDDFPLFQVGTTE